jgi:NADH-quinone oxidoreductase subunit N
MGDLTLFIPEATILAGALVALILSAIGAARTTTWLAAVAFALASLAAILLKLDATGEPFFTGIYRVDAFSQTLKLGIVAGLLLTTLISGPAGSFRPSVRIDIPIFLFFSALGMMMLVSATELLTLYVALELSAYGLYILAALHVRQRAGSEAAAKYILFGAASSAISLYGISLIFAACRSTDLIEIAQTIRVFHASPALLVGVFLALSGVLFKLAVFPFHAWAPDTYEGAPHEAVAFIGTASKVAAVGVIARLLQLVSTDDRSIAAALLICCVASMTVGNLAAMKQRDLKRLIAYSTVAHAGYIMIGLACLSTLGVASAIFYALTYVPVVFGAFLVISLLGSDGSNPTRESLAGLYQRSPLLMVTLLVAMFALAGIPPTVGFAAKWFLFSAAIDSGYFWLVLIGAVNATVSLYYYLCIIKEAILTPPRADATAIRVPPAFTLAAWLAIALTLAIGFYPRLVWELAENAAAALMGG